MSKRSQTTGLPKRRRRRATAAATGAERENLPANEAESGFKSRAEREAELQKWVIRGVAAAVIVLVALLAGAFAVEQLIIPRQAVAVVEGEAITVSEFRQEFLLEYNRLRLQLNSIQDSGYDLNQLAQQEPYKTWISEVNVPDQLGLRVINDMVDDRLQEREASARGITVSDAAERSAIETYFGFDPTQVALIGVEPTATTPPTITPTPFVSPTPRPTATPSPIPEPTAEGEAPPQEAEPTLTPQPTVVEPTQSAEEARADFERSEQDYRSYFDRVGVLDETLDGFFKRNALERLLAEDLVPAGEPLLYADARHILVEDEASAQAAIEALNAGESFAALARAISTDPGSGARGGELGEAFVGNYVPEFRQALEAAEIGALVGPVKSEFGYHIIQVRGKDYRHSAELEYLREQSRQQELAQLRESLRETHSDAVEITDAWLDYIPRV